METTERRRVIGLGDAPRTRRATLDGSQSTLDGSQYGRLAGRVCATVHAHPVSWSERTAWIAALETLPRFADNPHALSGNPRNPPDAYFLSIRKPWQHVRALAGLPGPSGPSPLLANVTAAAGNSLSFVGKPLGHARSTTTERYSRFALDSANAVADRIAEGCPLR